MTTARAKSARKSTAGTSGVERTIRASLATALGVLPLVELFTDVRWLFDVFAAIAIVGATAAILRRRQRPHVWHVWAGVALLIPWLTWRFLPQHAFGSFIPTRTTAHDLSAMLSSVRNTMSNDVAPVHPDRAITLVLAVIGGLLAAFVDFVAVMGRRPALAGVPLLIIYTVAGAVTRHPVSWVLFAAGGAAFLLLLSIDARDEVRDWGRLIPRAGEARPSAALGVSGPRIAVIAIIIAVVAPLVVPARASNLLANAFHNGHQSGDSTGFGTGGVALDPFAALKGELQRSKPVTLFSVTVSPHAVTPYYLRANVLSVYTNDGWKVDQHGGQQTLGDTSFGTIPPVSQVSTTSFSARISISALADNPPIFGAPTSVLGLTPDATWSGTDQLLIGTTVHSGQHITEQVQQPNPSIEDLDATTSDYPPGLLSELTVPTTIPKMVVDLVTQLTKGKSTQYDKARAISDYFTQAANGFIYSLQTKTGDSGSALVDFLTNKAGYCQQFAAAMGIMLRIAGIPARVVLGYTHPAPDRNGTFTVTTNNAHAWDEAFFTGIGWIPFDPTPITPAPGAATNDVVWAPHPQIGSANPEDTLPNLKTSTPPGGAVRTTPGASGKHPAGSSSPALSWSSLATLIVAVLVLGALASPATIRWGRRRRRLHAGRHGDPDALWAELSATATDLGYVWSAARTPRQVVGWLTPDVGRDSASLTTLAAAVEQVRYAPAAEATTRPVLVDELRDVEARLRAHRGRPTRIWSRLLPASLGWTWHRGMPTRRRH